jgi:predicted membrane protein
MVKYGQFAAKYSLREKLNFFRICGEFLPFKNIFLLYSDTKIQLIFLLHLKKIARIVSSQRSNSVEECKPNVIYMPENMDISHQSFVEMFRMVKVEWLKNKQLTVGLF